MVLADIWFEDVICVIDKVTGAVEKEYSKSVISQELGLWVLSNANLFFGILPSDFSTLWPKRERGKAGAGVLNGIAISDDPDVVYVTGKKWDRMFKVR